MRELGQGIEPNEGRQADGKSLQKVTRKAADFAELAEHCVAFANGDRSHDGLPVEERR